MTFGSAPRGDDLRASVELSAPAYVCGYGPQPGCAFAACVLELSVSEAIIRVERSVPLQGRVALLLRADDPPLDQTVAGVIVRATPSSSGMRYSLRFDALTDEARAQIARYVRAQAQRAAFVAHPMAVRPHRPPLRPPSLVSKAKPPVRGSGFHSAG
jgi:hypothetical protein